MGKKSKKKSKTNSQRNFIKQGGEGGGQRPFINFIKKQEKWSGLASLTLAPPLPAHPCPSLVHLFSAMSQVKSLVDTEKTSIVFNHLPIESLEATYTNHEVKRMKMDDLDHQVGLDVGQMHHYRGDCDFSVYEDCEERFLRNTVEDKSVWRWKDEVIRKSSNVLNKLGFI